MFSADSIEACEILFCNGKNILWTIRVKLGNCLFGRTLAKIERSPERIKLQYSKALQSLRNFWYDTEGLFNSFGGFNCVRH